MENQNSAQHSQCKKILITCQNSPGRMSLPTIICLPRRETQTLCSVTLKSVDNYIPPESGQKFLSVMQYSSLHTLKKKEDIILSKAFSYFTYQHLCYTGYWATINCFARTLERRHRLHESEPFSWL